MIAPEPFFEPRGTPFSEYHRIRALLELGHTVDLVTYPFGEDVALPGLRVFRACGRRSSGGGHRPVVRQGAAGSLARRDRASAARCPTRYDMVHSHEEGAAIGVVLAWWLGVPHLYDMHSSLPQQLGNFKFSQSRVLRWVLRALRARGGRALARGDRHLPGAGTPRARAAAGE